MALLSSLYRSKWLTKQEPVSENLDLTNEYINLVSEGTKVADFNKINKDPCWIVPKTFYDFLYKTSEEGLKSKHAALTKKQSRYLTNEQRASEMHKFETNVRMGAANKASRGQRIEIPTGFLKAYANSLIPMERSRK